MPWMGSGCILPGRRFPLAFNASSGSSGRFTRLMISISWNGLCPVLSASGTSGCRAVWCSLRSLRHSSPAVPPIEIGEGSGFPRRLAPRLSVLSSVGKGQKHGPDGLAKPGISSWAKPSGSLSNAQSATRTSGTACSPESTDACGLQRLSGTVFDRLVLRAFLRSASPFPPNRSGPARRAEQCGRTRSGNFSCKFNPLGSPRELTCGSPKDGRDFLLTSCIADYTINIQVQSCTLQHVSRRKGRCE